MLLLRQKTFGDDDDEEPFEDAREAVIAFLAKYLVNLRNYPRQFDKLCTANNKIETCHTQIFFRRAISLR